MILFSKFLVACTPSLLTYAFQICLQETILMGPVNIYKTGDEVIYLDPHTTQKFGIVDQKMDDNDAEIDATYHCKTASRIPITGMDPSVALVSTIFDCTPTNKYKISLV